MLSDTQRRTLVASTDAREWARAPILFMGLLGLDSHNQEEAAFVRHLAERGHPLLYLAPLGVRDAGLRELLGGLRRLRRAAQPGRPADGLRTAVLAVLPWRGRRPVTWLNRQLVRWRLRRLLRPFGAERPIIWLRLPTPELVALLPDFRPRAVVYECIDDYPTYPQYRPPDLARLGCAERRLVERTDLLITLTETVAARFPQARERVRVIPLGADLARFGHADGPIPSELAALPRPRLGLVGGLDERVDFDLLRHLAVAEPGWSLALIGPLVDRRGAAALRGLPNVRLLGPRPAERIPAYLRGLDAGLIPYRRTTWTEGCFPAKLHEYLAAGLPVVATALPGLAPYGGLVELAAEPAEFVAACRRAVAEADPARAAARRALAERHSLDARCAHIDALLAALPA